MWKEFEIDCTKRPLEMKLKGIKRRGMQGDARVWERDWKQIANIEISKNDYISKNWNGAKSLNWSIILLILPEHFD